MGLLKILLAFVLLAPICQTYQTDHTDAMTLMKMMESPAGPNRTRMQVPRYLYRLHRQGVSDDGTVMRAFFSDAEPHQATPQGNGNGDDCYKSSCYSFHGQAKTWTENRQECKKQGGDLVSIEEDDEWTFLKDKIQGLNNLSRNEWHIGLKKEGSKWKWLNGAPLTISRWQVTEGQPSGDGAYVVMAKNYPPGTQGLFNDLPGWMKRGCICETTQGPQGNFEITVSRLAIPWEKDDQQWKRELVNVVTKTVAWRKGGKWIDLDVTSAVKYWNKYKSKNYGLWVSVRGDGVPSSDFSVAKGGREDPFLVTLSVDETASEVEGDEADENVEFPQSLLVKTNATQAGNTRTTSDYACSLHSAGFVAVSKLGLEKWIIAPRKFSASHCKGSCMYELGSTSHANFQRQLAFGRRVPEPCCTPRKFKGVPILYFNSNGDVESKLFSDIVPTKCDC